MFLARCCWPPGSAWPMPKAANIIALQTPGQLAVNTYSSPPGLGTQGQTRSRPASPFFAPMFLVLQTHWMSHHAPGTAALSQCLKSPLHVPIWKGMIASLLAPFCCSLPLNTHTHTPSAHSPWQTPAYPLSLVMCHSSQWNLPQPPPSPLGSKSLSLWSLTTLLPPPLIALSCCTITYLILCLWLPGNLISFWAVLETYTSLAWAPSIKSSSCKHHLLMVSTIKLGAQ